MNFFISPTFIEFSSLNVILQIQNIHRLNYGHQSFNDGYLMTICYMASGIQGILCLHYVHIVNLDNYGCFHMCLKLFHHIVLSLSRKIVPKDQFANTYEIINSEDF